MTQNVDIQLSESISYIRSITAMAPGIGIILGSGLGHFADQLQDSVQISCQKIPHYPKSTVEGHKGMLVFGKLQGIPVLALQGRVHSYEGYSMQQVTYPVRLMSALGISSLIVTNAAGGVNTTFSPGDLMLIMDHINMSFNNPLIGIKVQAENSRFVDMAQAYDLEYLQIAETAAAELGIPLQMGVLCMMRGPSYETAAEVRMIRILGGDAGTMSTVPEVIVARQSGLRVLGLSCITNMATGVTDQRLDHHEVTVVANKIAATFVKLLTAVIRRMETA